MNFALFNKEPADLVVGKILKLPGNQALTNIQKLIQELNNLLCLRWGESKPKEGKLFQKESNRGARKRREMSLPVKNGRVGIRQTGFKP